jgi:methyl coenzyme M reductase subunit C-like uncharacterized protein (methanogenesis marker protein 7)
MQKRHVRLVAAVAPVLAEEVTHRLPAVPSDHQGRIEKYPVAGLGESVVELVVLVRQQPLVPAPEVPGQLRRIGTERHVFDLERCSGVVVRRVPDAEA